MTPDTARGACPQCGQRISVLQAAWFGARRPFPCRRCGTRIAKTSSRYFVIAPLIIAALYLARREGMDSLLTWGALALGCVLVVADALFVGEVQRSPSPE